MLFVRISWNTPPALHRSAATTPDFESAVTFTVER
jgi:hypothetical protein